MWFKQWKENVPEQKTANVSEKAKQMCYICKKKPINVDVVRYSSNFGKNSLKHHLDTNFFWYYEIFEWFKLKANLKVI